MKRIVVTGAKGGTGTGIVSTLEQRGIDVVQVDIVPIDPASGPGYVKLDLRDADGVNDVFAGAEGGHRG